MKERYLLEEEVGENGFSLITDYDGNDEHVFDVNINPVIFFRFSPFVIWCCFPEYFYLLQ